MGWYTLGGLTRVWRTGVGIDRRGNLIYVAADDQTVISLAEILRHVGAVRAMEFDISPPEWHTLITYTHEANGLVPTMVGLARCGRPPPLPRAPDDRDFFAVYLPLPDPVTVPSSRDHPVVVMRVADRGEMEMTGQPTRVRVVA